MYPGAPRAWLLCHSVRREESMWEESPTTTTRGRPGRPDAAAPGSSGSLLCAKEYSGARHTKSAFDENARRRRAVSFDDLHKYAGVDLRRDNEVLEELTQRAGLSSTMKAVQCGSDPNSIPLTGLLLRLCSGTIRVECCWTSSKEETGYEVGKDVASSYWRSWL